MAEPGDAAAFVPACQDRLQHQLLDTARVLMLFGAVTAVGSLSVSFTLACLGLLLWLLGVCLMALVPVTGRFPRANQGAMPGHRARHIAPADVQQGHRELVTEAASALMLWGAAVTVSIVAGNIPASPTRAFIWLFMWLLGVCFLAFAPAAGQAAAAAGAVANAVFRHLFSPP